MTTSSAMHVVMLVGNAVQHDARVRKTALSMAATGLRVTVVAATTEEESFEEELEGLRVINVASPLSVRRQRDEHRRFRRWLALPVGYGTWQVWRARADRRRFADLELMAAMGRAVAAGHYGPGAPRRAALGKAARRARKTWNLQRRRVLYARSLVRRLYTARLPLPAGLLRRYYALPGVGSWRRLVPEYVDLAVAFAHVLDGLDFDLVHANDVNMAGIAETAVARARLNGRQARWLYDAHEYVPGMSRYRPDRIQGMASHERQYAPRADAVLTVSEEIADAVRDRCGLGERPTVVLNTPTLRRPVLADPPSIRVASGLGPDVPLIVYSGNIDPDRGLTTFVESLRHLPGVHAVVVTNAPRDNRYRELLTETAATGGALDRLHFVPYVANDRILEYIGSATCGFHGLSHVPNHEMALPNKYFDYLHARLPVVVSDVRAMAALTRELGNGEVYTAGDPRSLAEAARLVLADPDRYRKPLLDDALLRRYSWEHQEELLCEVYSRLLGVPLRPNREERLTG